MHICMLTELFYPYIKGGAEKRYVELAKRLSKKHEITVYALKMFGSEEKEVWNNIEIKRVGIKFNPNKRPKFIIASFLPALLKSLKSEYDIIDANQGFASLVGYFSRLIKKPIVATFHDLYQKNWLRYRFIDKIGILLESCWRFGKFDLIFANSSETKRKLLSSGFNSIIKVIPSGIDIKLYENLNVRKDDVIVYVGRLEPYKRVDILLNVAKHLEYEIHVIGTGSLEKKLKQKAPSNVSFLGFISEKEKIRELKRAKVLVNPSEVEGFGLVLLEAMACKTLPIARNLLCYRDFANEQNAILINNMNEKLLLKAIIYGMEHWDYYAHHLFETAKRYDWNEISKKVEKEYIHIFQNKTQKFG